MTTATQAAEAPSSAANHHADLLDAVTDNIGRVIIGKAETVRLAAISLISRGHILIEDVPGVGKTMLARSIAVTTGCEFRRIQFTPDLLPSDVTGASVYNQQTATFEFRPGPVISQVVLADEINRATPKTQSALLEAMGEQQVSVEGISRILPSPFIVLATQNPIEYEGTFPLPEAQLDRFFMRISLGYPTMDQEVSIMDDREGVDPIERLESSCSPADIVALQRYTDTVYIDDLVKRYIVGITGMTREHPDSILGASPRASINLMRAAKARAVSEAREFVTPDDVKSVAVPVLAHRVLISPSARMRGVTQEDVVESVLSEVEVPGAGGAAARRLRG